MGREREREIGGWGHAPFLHYRFQLWKIALLSGAQYTCSKCTDFKNAMSWILRTRSPTWPHQRATQNLGSSNCIHHPLKACFKWLCFQPTHARSRSNNYINKVIVPKLLPIIFYQQLCFQAPTNHCQHAATTQKKLHTNTNKNRTKKKKVPSTSNQIDPYPLNIPPNIC